MNAAATDQTAEHIAYIGLGSNIEPEKYLPLAIQKLKERAEVLSVSSAWRAPAVGKPAPDFLNAAVKLGTPLTEEELKQKILRPIEEYLGRVRGPDKFAPRTIDLDVVVFDDEQLDPDLWKYAHLAVPLAEIYPGYLNPKTGERLEESARKLEMGTGIKKQLL